MSEGHRISENCANFSGALQIELNEIRRKFKTRSKATDEHGNFDEAENVEGCGETENERGQYEKAENRDEKKKHKMEPEDIKDQNCQKS